MSPFAAPSAVAVAVALAATAAACEPADVELHEDSQAMVMGIDRLPATVDYVAVQSGLWSDPATWSGNAVPTRTGAGTTLDIAINSGFTVTFDALMSASQYIDTLALHGTLDFDPSKNTRLYVDTLVSLPGGLLQVGTAATPIAATKTAEIVIPNGPFAPDDVFQLGKGLILNGPVRMYGAAKRSFTAITSGFGLGSDRIKVAELDPAWVPGDEIVISPTKFVPAQDQNPSTAECGAERFRIYSIEGDGSIRLGTADSSPVTPAALATDHTPYPGQQVHVANLTRNVVVRSKAATVPTLNRGHVMIARGRAQIHNVELRHLGRTDKKTLLNDGNKATNTPGTNQRGRYALHFHRTRESNAPDRSYVTGSVVNTSPGWGFVNHSSDVEVTDSVSYDTDGAGFVAEASDELGSFQRNIAICGDGDPGIPYRYRPRRFEGDFDGGAADGTPDRTATGDLAFTGDGFWVQSPLVAVTDNIAAGMHGHGFALWNHGLYEPDRGMVVGPRVTDLSACPSGCCYRTFDYPASIPDVPNYGARALANDNPSATFERNTAYASFMGVMVRFNNHPNLKPMRDSELSHVIPLGAGCTSNSYLPGSVVQTTTAWNNYFGLGLSYAVNLTINGAQIFSNQDMKALGLSVDSWAVNADSNLCDENSAPQFIDLIVQGYKNPVNYDPTCP